MVEALELEPDCAACDHLDGWYRVCENSPTNSDQGAPTMTSRRTTRSMPEEYWERAGQKGYGEAMYNSADVELHVRSRCWQLSIEIADHLSVPRDGYVLDFGCGDGAFANAVLARTYRTVDGFDLAEGAIDRARAEAPGPHVRFQAADLTSMDYASLPRYDAAFLIGILHHVKQATPALVAKLAQVTDTMIVLEPNGNNLVRKMLEFTASYKAAGEDSFRTKELMDIFLSEGFKTVVWKRTNLFPNFTPSHIYRLFSPLEAQIEASRFWNALCTVNMFGFQKR